MFAEIGRDGGGVMGGDGEGVKGRNSRGGLTLPLIWQEKAREGYVDLGSYVTRRGVFTENVTRFGKRYAGDFDFIDALWEGGYSFAGEEVFVDEALGAMMVQGGKAREMEGPNPPTPFPEREGGVEVRVVRAKERAVSK